MPWNTVEPMEQRMLFVSQAKGDDCNFSVLCEEFGISRKTGYKWLQRYACEGFWGLRDQSRAPRSCPHKTSDHLVKRLVELREQYPLWGPKKLVALLEREIGKGNAPAPSTAGDILKKHGLVRQRKVKRRGAGHTKNKRLEEPKAPNDVWAVDYKGWFRTQDGRPCYPFTATDLFSRYVLCVNAHKNERLGQVDEDMTTLFMSNGLPKAIRMDNGIPFGSNGLKGMTQLSLHWLLLGINLEFIDAGKPQQNGRHERMHRTLKLEAVIPPSEDLETQQQRFNRWRTRFNTIRPHESIGQLPPEALYSKSSVVYTGRPQVVYPDYFETRSVRRDGYFNWNGELYHCGAAFVQTRIGLHRDHTSRWIVYAGDLPVGWICDQEKSVKELGARS